MNLAQYLREFSDKSFREAPFSEVDALVFAQLSYLRMTGIVPGFGDSDGVTWKEMASHPNAEQLFTDPIFGKAQKKVFYLVLHSRRYQKVRVRFFAEWFNEETQTQFAAVTFLLGKTSVFVAYRGTDESLIGWKEDFNMGYMKSIPAQRRALAYLKGVGRYTEGRLILGGHSKGGNLAIYAASRASDELQKRIRRVYSFDGPGFRKEFYGKQGFIQVQDKYCKIMPEDSLVGMLFVNYPHYRIVESYRSGIGQHDLMQWKVRKGKFVYRKDLDWRSKRRSAILNAWFDSLTREQTMVFVETLYQLLAATNMDSVYEMLKAPIKVIKKGILFLFHLDDETKKIVRSVVRTLLQVVRNFVRS